MNKNVLSKLSKIESKVELAEVKVDLALIDDVNKAHSSAITAQEKGWDEMLMLKKKVQETLKTVQDAVNIHKDALVNFDKFDAAAKSLGIEVPKQVIAQRQYVENGLKKILPDYIKALNSIKIL